MITATADVTLTGPLFNGRLQRDFNRAVAEGAEEAAERVRRNVRRADAQSFRRSSGYTSSRVAIRRTGPAGYRVHGGGLIWRPWLEGIAPRNRRSRFKGHRSFQRARQPSELDAVDAVQEHVRKVFR